MITNPNNDIREHQRVDATERVPTHKGEGGPQIPTLYPGFGFSVAPSAYSNHSQRQAPISVKPSKSDVLLGRGRGFFEHEGNKRFMAYVEEQSALYNDTEKDARGRFCREIVEQVQNWGARFLEKKPDGDWYIAEDEKARRKVGQALRYRLRQNNPIKNAAATRTAAKSPSRQEASPSRSQPAEIPDDDRAPTMICRVAKTDLLEEDDYEPIPLSAWDIPLEISFCNKSPMHIPPVGTRAPPSSPEHSLWALLENDQSANLDHLGQQSGPSEEELDAALAPLVGLSRQVTDHSISPVSSDPSQNKGADHRPADADHLLDNFEILSRALFSDTCS